MFALQINFNSTNNQPSEMLFVKRQVFTIGGAESCDVNIADLKSIDRHLKISRFIGSRFKCQPIFNNQSDTPGFQNLLEEEHTGFATLKLGNLDLNIVALDSDLRLKELEVPDRASIRMLRQAATIKSPEFPALLIKGEQNFVVSFIPSQIIHIGHSNTCEVRIDSPEISNRHARIGSESGKFWIEDLGSTNGTFLSGQQISGKKVFDSLEIITLGKSFKLLGINNFEELQSAQSLSVTGQKNFQSASIRKYPILLAISEAARPARLVLPLDGVIELGRDPSSDIWLGAPHVSRKHCEILLNKNLSVTIKDRSTNGTGCNGQLLRDGASIELNQKPAVLDFGGDLTLGVCFTAEDEKAFIEKNGSPEVFLNSTNTNIVSSDKNLTPVKISSNFTKNIGEQRIFKFIPYYDVFMALSFVAKLVIILAFFGFVAIVLIVIASIKALLF